MIALMSKDIPPMSKKGSSKGRRMPAKTNPRVLAPRNEEEELSTRERILKLQAEMDPRNFAPTPHKRKAFSACSLDDDDSDAENYHDKENNSSKSASRGQRNASVRKSLPLKSLSRAQAAAPRSAMKSSKVESVRMKSVAFHINDSADSENSEDELKSAAGNKNQLCSKKKVSYNEDSSSGDTSSSSDSDSDEEDFETKKSPQKRNVYDF